MIDYSSYNASDSVIYSDIVCIISLHIIIIITWLSIFNKYVTQVSLLIKLFLYIIDFVIKGFHDFLVSGRALG